MKSDINTELNVDVQRDIGRGQKRCEQTDNESLT